MQQRRRSSKRLALDRSNGKILWRREAPTEKIEPIESDASPNNPAAPTAATNGKSVVVFFGSYGLLAYNFAGELLWKKPQPTNSCMHGSGSSPVFVENLLLMELHLTADPCLLALRPEDGEIVWKAPKSPRDRGWATPITWREGREAMVGTLLPGRFTAHRVSDGKEKMVGSGPGK